MFGRIHLVLFLLILCFAGPLTRLQLSDWEFTVRGKFNDQWRPASLPSNIHLDLLSHGLIPDPFNGTNGLNLSWIENATIVYRTKFAIGDQMNQAAFKELVFDGIDGEADVYLNNEKLMTAKSSFMQYTVDVKTQLQKNNILQVSFDPNLITAEHKEVNSSANFPYDFSYHRKPAYQYGRAMVPRMVTVGIYKPVWILAYHLARFDYVWVRTRTITSHIDATTQGYISQAELSIAAVVRGNMTSVATNLELVIKVNGVEEPTKPKFYDKYLFYNLTIADAKLWWPRGLGEPYQYDLEFVLKAFDFELETKKMKFGIRSIRVENPQSQFSFYVNQYSIFLRGGTYLPSDLLYSRINNPKLKPAYSLKATLDDFEESNINMLRIWGGGLYQSDEFYEECSRRGILLLHDFMFSYGPYPDYRIFLERVQSEAKYQIRRLRNYPCIAFWNGNDGVSRSSYSWFKYSSGTLWKQAAETLFERLIKTITQLESPQVAYVLPNINNYPGSSDYDSTWIFQNTQSLDKLGEAYGRLTTKFGMQAMPVWQTIESFTLPDERSYSSKAMLYHQQYQDKYANIRDYIEAYMRQSVSFQMEVYQSGVMQAEGIKSYIAAQRSDRLRAIGCLVWHLNDAWPGTTYSTIDYYGRWKPAQYAIKTYFTPVAVFFQVRQTDSYFHRELKLVGVNDNLYNVTAFVKVKALTTEGDVLYNFSKTIQLSANSSSEIHSIPANSLPNYNSYGKERVFFYAEIVQSKQSMMSLTYFLVRHQNMAIPKTPLNVKYYDLESSFTVSADKLIKDLYISLADDQYIRLSNNYFDVVPGVPVTIFIRDYNLTQIKDRLRFTSYRQSFMKGQKLMVNIL